MKFEDLDLVSPLKKSVSAAGYEVATPIQAKAIPHVLTRRDVLGCAQTGTGKTAAFTLPMLQLLLAEQTEAHPASGETWKMLPKQAASPKPQPRERNRYGRNGKPMRRRGGDGRRGWVADGREIRAVILAPTRELAGQIADSVGKYGRFTELRHTCIFGGVKQGPQVRDLQLGVDIVIATPGRLLDLIQQGFVKLRSVETLVLDEADQMLDMGFLPDLTKIIAKIPEKRQTLMFSATMSREIRELADKWLTRPLEVSVTPIASTPDRVSQAVYFVDRSKKSAALNWYLQSTERSRTLVFSRTKRGADRIAKTLEQAGVDAVSIHGDKSQARRQSVIRQFKSSRPPVLVATDLAARGLDFSDISHVINFDLPDTPETYVHRIGRTARAGASGKAISFCSRDERNRLRSIERLTGQTVPADRVPREIDDFQTEKPKSQRPNQSGGFSNKKQRSERGDYDYEQRSDNRPAKAGKSKSYGAGSGSGNDGSRGAKPKRKFKKKRFGSESPQGSTTGRKQARPNSNGNGSQGDSTPAQSGGAAQPAKRHKAGKPSPNSRKTSGGSNGGRANSSGARPKSKRPKRKFASAPR